MPGRAPYLPGWPETSSGSTSAGSRRCHIGRPHGSSVRERRCAFTSRVDGLCTFEAGSEKAGRLHRRSLLTALGARLSGASRIRCSECGRGCHGEQAAGEQSDQSLLHGFPSRLPSSGPLRADPCREFSPPVLEEQDARRATPSPSSLGCSARKIEATLALENLALGLSASDGLGCVCGRTRFGSGAGICGCRTARRRGRRPCSCRRFRKRCASRLCPRRGGRNTEA
jgi:hypothetical protein